VTPIFSSHGKGHRLISEHATNDAKEESRAPQTDYVYVAEDGSNQQHAESGVKLPEITPSISHFSRTLQKAHEWNKEAMFDAIQPIEEGAAESK